MINVLDNYLDESTFNSLQKYCDQEFKIIDAGEKQFSTLPTPQEIIPLFQINGYDLFFTFIRSAYKEFDADLRIHADNIINGNKTDLACVFYINEKKGVTNNGTAFYTHKDYGQKLPQNIDNQEFDRMIKEDSNDLSKWKLTDKISAIPNRILIYNANYFHSKFPQIIEEGTRKVLVCFYKKSKE